MREPKLSQHGGQGTDLGDRQCTWYYPIGGCYGGKNKRKLLKKKKKTENIKANRRDRRYLLKEKGTVPLWRSALSACAATLGARSGSDLTGELA